MTLLKKPDGSYPAPLPPDEPERLRALREYHVLDSMPEQVYDDIVFLAAQICETPIAVIGLIDADRQWFKARIGLDGTESPRDLTFCAHAILEPDNLMQVPDATRDERFNTNPAVTDGLRVRFYAGIPLLTPDGRALGTLCTIDSKPRELTPDQQRALRALSREVMTQLELRRTILQLERALAARKPAEEPRAKPVVAKLEEPGDEVEERMRGLLARMQQLQRRTS